MIIWVARPVPDDAHISVPARVRRVRTGIGAPQSLPTIESPAKNINASITYPNMTGQESR